MIDIERPHHVAKQICLWAIDPFDDAMMANQTLVHQLMNLARTSNLEIQPVYVESTRPNWQRTIQGNGDTSTSVRDLESLAADYLERLSLTGVLPTRVIQANLATRKDEVEKVVELSEELNASFVVVSSHGRSGVNRLILGSFAENLLHLSKRPVLFLTHLKQDHARTEQIQRVLFSTDFSESSHKAFLHFLLQAKSLSFEVRLFYSVTLPASALVSSDGALLGLPENYFLDQMKWAEEEGARWIALAESKGVKARLVVIDEGVCANIGETILSTALQEQVDMIAMASVSGAVASFVMGSVAREVFRSNLYPVWLYGPKALEKLKQPAIELPKSA